MKLNRCLTPHTTTPPGLEEQSRTTVEYDHLNTHAHALARAPGNLVRIYNER